MRIHHMKESLNNVKLNELPRLTIKDKFNLMFIEKFKEHDMSITTAHFQRIIKSKVDVAAWTSALNTILPKYGITGTKQIAMFMAQCGHESGDFNFYNENLNYSAEGLNTTFHKYFPTVESAT